MIQIYRGLFNHLSIRQFPCFQFFQLQIELPCTFLCKFLCGLSFLFLQVRTRSMIAISYKRSYLAYTHLVYNAGDPGLIPESGRSSGEGNGIPLQYSCLENPITGGTWYATVHGVAKSQTRLINFTSLQNYSQRRDLKNKKSQRIHKNYWS